jgi:hypothetical protein
MVATDRLLATSLTDLASDSDKAITGTARKVLEGTAQNSFPDTSAAENLLEFLHYDPELASRHLETCLEIGDTLDDRGKARASAMVESDKLRIWLAEDAFSSPLLVNGRCDLENIEGRSPLSFVDAQLTKVFERGGQALVIKYFCDLHRKVDIASRGTPTAKMMASLVGELLTQMLARKFGVDVSFLTNIDRKKIENVDLDILCNLFRELTLQLPPRLSSFVS